MYKYIITFSLLIIFGCAGSLQVIETERKFQKTFDNLELNKSDIYIKSLQWLAKSFVDSKEVIEFQDENTGKIIGKGMSSVIFNPTLIAPININIQYTLTIEIKDNKARITYSNFYSEDVGGGQIMEDNYLKLEPKLEALSLNYQNYLMSEEEDW